MDRPIQDSNGQWYDNFGGTKISGEQARREEAEVREIRRQMKEAEKGEDQTVPHVDSPPNLDVDRLKNIYEKCVARYEGKYENGLLDINVVLDEADKGEVKKLIETAGNIHKGFADKNPQWVEFIKLRDEMRSVLGTFGEDARIIEDNSVQIPTKGQTKNNSPVIKVPTDIYRLSVWDSKIGLLDRSFDQYGKGNAKGTMASYLGNSIKEVYGFVKESRASRGQQ